MRMRSLALALFIAAVVFAFGPANADCRLHDGDHVILFGTTDDPAVFVWDSRYRMREYQGGSWDQGQALLPHAFLAPPGTRGIVSSCINNFVQSKYSSLPDDAIGIVIVSGPLKGKMGWVLGADIRGVYHAMSSQH